jgi:hypothetical protein
MSLAREDAAVLGNLKNDGVLSEESGRVNVEGQTWSCRAFKSVHVLIHP